MAGRNARLSMVLIMVSAPISGCFGKDALSPSDVEDHWLPPVEAEWDAVRQLRRLLPRLLERDLRDRRCPIRLRTDPSMYNRWRGRVTGGAEVHLGLWLPVIEECDWDAGSVVEGCQVPVIAEIGPYYDDGDVDALTPRITRQVPHRELRSPWLGSPRSVFGTGESNHCMNSWATTSRRESRGPSTGSACSHGRPLRSVPSASRHDGSTPWNAAATSSEYLATIVPMSGS